MRDTSAFLLRAAAPLGFARRPNLPPLRSPHRHYAHPLYTPPPPSRSLGTSYPTSVLTDLRHSTRLLRHAWRTAIENTTSTYAIDATAGRGSDTITLASMLGSDGTIHAFDVQQSALDETLSRIDAERKSIPLANVVAHRVCHSNLAVSALPQASVAVVAYNLGWYPAYGADRSVITHEVTTVASLSAALSFVAVGGVISVMAYIGHPGGREEEAAVERWLQQLDHRQWSVTYIKYPNRHNAPSLAICERLL